MAEKKKSNVDILIEAGALDPNDLTAEHADVVNNHFSAEEMDTLIKMQQKIKGGKKLGSKAAF